MSFDLHTDFMIGLFQILRYPRHKNTRCTFEISQLIFRQSGTTKTIVENYCKINVKRQLLINV